LLSHQRLHATVDAGVSVSASEAFDVVTNATDGPCESVVHYPSDRMMEHHDSIVVILIALLSQADCSETRQSFQMTVDLIAKAESGDTWSVPVLHLLYLLRHMLHAEHLSHVLPALLRLQHNAQVCSNAYT
jgi:hypothetical protein